MELVDLSPSNSSTYAMTGTPDIYTFMDSKHQNWCVQKLGDHLRNGAYTDIVIKVQGGVEIPCHKIILSSSCPYFHRMFGSGMRESFSDSVVLKGIKPTVAEMIIEYLYSFKIPLTVDNVQDITEACVQLELTHLEEACDTFMAKHLDGSNCFGLLMFANTYSLPETLKSAMVFVNKKLLDILKQAENHEYQILDEETLVKIVSSDKLMVEDEEHVFQLVVKWIGVDFKNRWKAVDKVMQLVRFPFCSPDYLDNVVKNHQYFGSPKCQALLAEAKAYQVSPTDNATNLRMKPRKPLQQLVVIGGDEDNAGCWFLRDGEEEWENFAPLPEHQLYDFQVCDMDRDIWLTGGINKVPDAEDSQVSKESWCYSPTKKKWKAMEDMLEPRCQHSLVQVKGELFALGGWCGSHYLKSVERLDPITNTWVSAAPMLEFVCNLIAVAVNNNIYAFDCLMETAQIYNVEKDEWQIIESMPGKCDRGSVAVHDDKIFLFSDRNCMLFDTKTDTWSMLAKAPCSTVLHSSAVWQDKILLAGGLSLSSAKKATHQVSVYDTEEDEWITCEKHLPKAMYGHRMVAMKVFRKDTTDANNN